MKGVGEAGRYNRRVSLVIDCAGAQAMLSTMPANTPEQQSERQTTPQSGT